MDFSLPLPPRIAYQTEGNLENSGVVVIVGANGAGKSRYGVWLEFDTQLSDKVRRVAAHKMLSFPESIIIESVDNAKKEFNYGHVAYSSWGHRKAGVYNQKPATSQINDFQNLVKYLFAEHQDVAAKYHQLAHTSGGTTQQVAPTTRLLEVKEVWDSVHLHRELVLGGAKVEAKPRSGTAQYNAAEMSDGERVSFYLIAQCLLAEPSGVIVIDEPELHLNRSIQSKLWNAIEAKRSDCQFVYLTHDLDFAASRATAKKLWFKGYTKSAATDSGSENDSSWEWVELPNDTGFPDELLLTVVGSRKPILFVEGDKSSEDFLIYDHFYIGHTVIPRGGCTQVISATNGFNGLSDLHAFDCQGIVDRDYRTDTQIERLQTRVIHVIDVSEVENLLLTEEVLQVIEDSFLLQPEESKIVEVKEMVLAAFEAEKLRIVGSIAKNRLNTMLPTIKDIPKTEQSFSDSFKSGIAQVNPKIIYEEAEAMVEDIIKTKDYQRALKVFDEKSLLNRLAGYYNNMNKTDFLSHFKRVLGSKHGAAIRQALSKYLPAI